MERLDFLKDILTSGFVGTQDELCDKLSRQGYDVTQSTVSRDLRRLGAVKAIDEEGRTVIHTTPGSASLVALHIDRNLDEVLGTIAGDDTIFVAPASLKNIPATIALIRESL
jgi:transcriptional regulator of arginine metabolism